MSTIRPETENEALCRRWVEEVLNQENPSAVDEIVAPEAIVHDLTFTPYTPSELQGKSFVEQAKQGIDLRKRLYDDARVTIDQMVSAGDRVVVVLTGQGVLDGTRFMVREIAIVRFADGKAVEGWTLSDDLGFFQQLGAVPETRVLFERAGIPT